MDPQHPEPDLPREAAPPDDEDDADGLDEPAPAPPGEAVQVRRAEAGEAWHGLRLDKALVAMAPEFSRSHLQGLVERGHVRIDGRAVQAASRPLKLGQVLEVDLVPTAQARAFRAEPVPLVVVHEDAQVLVVDKPAGLVVHPAAGNWSGTLLNGLLHRDPKAAALPRAGIVHRLDKDTSGLMVVARTLPAMHALVRQLAARTVRREYMALVHGDVGGAGFSVDAPIGRDPRSRVRMAVVREAAGGRPARTDVEPVACEHGISAVRCRLHTGRTHQIRVHLASCGHPLVGDALYGGRALPGLTRQALHAARLAFEHPAHGAPVQFEAAPPQDLASAWATVVSR